MTSSQVVEDIREITQEILLLRENYEEICNNQSISIETKQLFLHNFDIAYEELKKCRDKLMKEYVRS